MRAYNPISNSTKYVTDPEQRSMGYFEKLPGFDLETFPFVVASSTKGINLVNVKESYCEPLILCEQTTTDGQRAFFFTRESYGMSMHFTISRALDNRKMRLEWVRMAFKSDFIETLRQVGRLPVTNTAEAIKVKQELKELQWLRRDQHSRYGRKLQEEYKSLKEDLNEKEARLQESKAALERRKAVLKQKDNALEESRRALASTEADLQRNRAAIDEKEAAIKEKEKILKKMDEERAMILERLSKVSSAEEAYEEVCRILEEHEENSQQQ